MTFRPVSGGLSEVVEDLTPQLGGNLDAQDFNITDVGQLIIDSNSTESLLVRKDGDGGDIFTINGSTERVGIGLSFAPFQKLHINETFAAGAGGKSTTLCQVTLSSGTHAPSMSAGLYIGVTSGSSVLSGTGTSASSGLTGLFQHQSTGTIAQAAGLAGIFSINTAAPAGTVTQANGTVGQVLHATTGTVTTASCLRALAPVNAGGGTITDCVGLDIEDVNVGTNNFAIRTGDGLVELGDLIDLSTTSNITASATQTQGQQALTTTVNEISTVGSNGDVVTLPAAKAGRIVFIANNGANSADVYPASGDDIDGAGVDTAVAQASGTNKIYVAHDATNWDTY